MSRLSFVSEFKPQKEKTVAELAEKSGVNIKLPCDGKGKCGKCTIQIISGTCNEPTKEEQKLLKKSALESGTRLACCCVPKGDVDVKL